MISTSSARLVRPLLCLALLGCAQTNSLGECICTAIFASVSTIVVDSSGTPMVGLSPTVTLLRTGQRVVPQGLAATGDSYPVFTDLNKTQLASAGDSVQFAVVSAGRAAHGVFFISAPGSCQCHVLKVSGPDTLVLR
jgi:hypothetical protein